MIRVEAEQGGKGKDFSISLICSRTPGFPFSPDGSLFTPARGNAVNRVGEYSSQGFAAMSDGVGFEEAWTRDSSHGFVLMGICFLKRVSSWVVVFPRFL